MLIGGKGPLKVFFLSLDYVSNFLVSLLGGTGRGIHVELLLLSEC